ncbi:olfactory receptor 1052-like [Myiozetetes cayanensis]|uniref:olfactory receptor 1052-like n=1 Tax=Myiozetetes cayanensis TaxID=478635 RepID=UPI00216023BB|nr:olfactory receptor 1052-like [Myiozetetes cayanensis]
MADGNCTEVPQFTLAGLTEHPQLKFILLGLFLGTYTLTLVGNLGLIVLIRVSPQLHTPMYFFLSALSFLDVCYSSTISPRMLLDLPAGPRAMSLAGCLAQLYFYAAFCTAEAYLLAVMAYDRFVAISQPLLYQLLMSPALCARLVAGCFLGGLLSAATHAGAALRLSFCGPLLIDDFYCDGPPLFLLASSDRALNEALVLMLAGFNIAATSLLILGSYACAAVAVGRTGPGAGWRKACSTCSAHLAALGILYVSIAFNYMQPSSARSLRSKKVASVFYTVVVPLVNPVVYSLRNEEVKNALGIFIGRMHS